MSSPLELFHTIGNSWQTDMFSLDIAVTPGKESDSYLSVNNSLVSQPTEVFQRSIPFFWEGGEGCQSYFYFF